MAGYSTASVLLMEDRSGYKTETAGKNNVYHYMSFKQIILKYNNI